MNENRQPWLYAAEDRQGVMKSGAVEARDVDHAARILKADGLHPVALTPKRARGFTLIERASQDGASLSLRRLARLSRRLADLLRASLPLAQALRLAAEQTRDAQERSFLQATHQSVCTGLSLSDAVRKSGAALPRLFLALVEAGENLGALGPQFESLAEHYEKSLKLRKEIIAQLIYPIALVVLILMTLILLSFLVLPQFESIFATTDAAPPPETAFVLAGGRLVRDYWPIAAIAMLGGAAALPLLAKRNATVFERALLAAPVIGPLAQAREAGHYFRTLATLLAGGMPLARSLPLASASVQNGVLRAALNDAEVAVRSGDRLGAALSRSRFMPGELVSFIEIGDETGALAPMAAQAAALAESRVQSAIRSAMAALAPVLTALMGLLTAGVIAAVMSGVLSLNEMVY